MAMPPQVFLDPVYGLVIGMVVALLRDAAETARAESRVTLDKAIPYVPRLQICRSRLGVAAMDFIGISTALKMGISWNIPSGNLT
jgi:hypothetical protein